MLSIRLCTVDGPLWVVGRCVDRRESQRTIPGVNDVVPCTARHKNNFACTKLVPAIQPLLAASHADKRLSFFHTNHLICFGVVFHTDITANRDTHQGHLQVASCPKRGAEIFISPCFTHDVCYKRLGAVIGPAGVTASLHRMMRFHTLHSFLSLTYFMRLRLLLYAATFRTCVCLSEIRSK